MKRFDQSYARFLLDNGDYERLSRYCQSALDEGFAETQAFIDICNDKLSVQNDISSEENEIIYDNSTPETVVSNIRCFINYDNGVEEEVSLKDFVKLMKRKSNEGNTSAQYLLSEFYLDGNGVRKNIKKAFELMKSAELCSEYFVKIATIPKRCIIAHFYKVVVMYQKLIDVYYVFDYVAEHF